MEFDNDLVVGKLRRWEKYLAAYRLPAWEQIPDLGLYMEQVVLLLRQYLDYLPPELKQPEPITAAAINNYVRTRLLPEPRKKRYYRVHIAYLIMICTLKQALRLSELQTLLPGDLPEDEVRRTYDAYVRRHQLCAQYFIDQVRLTAAAMFDREVTMARRQDPRHRRQHRGPYITKTTSGSRRWFSFFRYTPILCVRQASPCVPYKKSNSCRKIRRSVIESKQAVRRAACAC